MSKILPDNVRPLRGFHDRTTPSGRRLRANWPAELRFEAIRLKCSMVDISAAGACVRVERLRAVTRRIHLVVANFPPIAVEIAWRRQNRIGLRFVEPQPWIVEACAERLDPAVWPKRKDAKKDSP